MKDMGSWRGYYAWIFIGIFNGRSYDWVRKSMFVVYLTGLEWSISKEYRLVYKVVVWVRMSSFWGVMKGLVRIRLRPKIFGSWIFGAAFSGQCKSCVFGDDIWINLKSRNGPDNIRMRLEFYWARKEAMLGLQGQGHQEEPSRQHCDIKQERARGKESEIDRPC